MLKNIEGKVEMMIVRGQDLEYGDIDLVENREVLTGRVIDMYIQNGKELTMEDLEYTTMEFELLDEMYSYMIIESLEREPERIISVPLEKMDAQRLVDFSKQIPGYTQDDLTKTLDLIKAMQQDIDMEELYW